MDLIGSHFMDLNLMDQLWKQEITSSDAEILVDFFPQYILPTMEAGYQHNVSSAKHFFHDRQLEPVKNNQVSNFFRNSGNEVFKKRLWGEAMEFYNQSLRFAKEGTVNISLAYANRSACFFSLKKYSQCLNDIELAMKAHYPQTLMDKLKRREIQCVQHLQEAPEMKENVDPQLSFDADANFPCMANVLQIQHSEQFGRHIVAKCDIDVGQTVLIEEAFVACFDYNDFTLCFTCLKPVMNFIPCPRCTDAVFCDETCMKRNDIHKIGCGATYNRLPTIQLVVNTILVALNAFPSVEHLMAFVEERLASPSFDLPRNSHDAQSRYGMFLKLQPMLKDADFDQMLKQYSTYKSIMDIPVLAAQFNSLKKQRFLMHLIWQHKLISLNFFTQSFPIIFTDSNSNFIRRLMNVTSLFNHSCTPNLYNQPVENKYVCTTLSPVKKGQQLFITYHPNCWNISTPERQAYLDTVFNFRCQCSRCVPISRPFRSAAIALIQKDANYRFLKDSRNWVDGSNKQRSIIMKGKCCKFLKKFSHLASTDEYNDVKFLFKICLQKD